MRRHPITVSPKRDGRYLVGTEHQTYFGNFHLKHFGPWILETDCVPGSQLTWWANLPKPGLSPGCKNKQGINSHVHS